MLKKSTVNQTKPSLPSVHEVEDGHDAVEVGERHGHVGARDDEMRRPGAYEVQGIYGSGEPPDALSAGSNSQLEQELPPQEPFPAYRVEDSNPTPPRERPPGMSLMSRP